MKLKERLTPYFRSVPQILLFKTISVVLLAVVCTCLSYLSKLLLGISGKVSVSSGDFGFVFTSPQGWLLLLLGLGIILLYIVVDVNAAVLFYAELLDGKKPSFVFCFKEGFRMMKYYASVRGLIVILYCTLLSPIIGISFSISLTQSLYIPHFVSSVIDNTLLFAVGEAVLTVVLYVISIVYRFIIHGVLLDGKTMKQSGIASRNMLRTHWKNYLWEMIRFIITLFVFFALCLSVALLPIYILGTLPVGKDFELSAAVFLVIMSTLVLIVYQMLASAFFLMKSIILYRTYRSEGEWRYKAPEKKRHPVIIGGAVASVVFALLLTIPTSLFFDDIFPNDVKPFTVAHRAGGFLAAENTVAGIEAGYKNGAFGGEIDIQRTSDGHYVVNHDNTFQRVTGVNKKSYEMTLAEAKKLRINGEPVATLEEMLDASRDRVTLFVELKGETADERMADDAVRIIKERGMEDQTVIISLNYNVLVYVEEKYPEMETGYLAFFSFGNIEDNPFDYLALEEEIATEDVIDAIHDKGKKIMIWTVNEKDSIRHFLLSDADMLITDEVIIVNDIREALEDREPLNRVFDEYYDLFTE